MRAVVVTSDNTYIVSCSSEVIRVWDFMDENEETEAELLLGHEDTIWSMAITSDNKYLVSGDGVGVIVWNLKYRQQEEFIHFDNIDCANFISISSDNKFIVSNSRAEGCIWVWSLEEKAYKASYPNPFALANDAAITSDSKAVVVGLSNNTVAVWNIQDQVETIFNGHRRGVTRLDVSSDNKYIIAASPGDISLWDVNNRRQVIDFSDISKDTLDLKLTRSSKYIIVSSKDYTFRIWKFRIIIGPDKYKI